MELKAISELKNYIFVIPYQQRGYKWTPDNITMLLNDLKEFIDSDKQMYCLQPIAVVPDTSCEQCLPSLLYSVSDSNNNYCKKVEVIDGQQRLTTLYLLWKYLQLGETYHFEYERDDDNERNSFLDKIYETNKIHDSKIDYFYISQAYLAIKQWFDSDNKEYIKRFKDLLLASKEKKSIQVLWYEIDKDKEHEAFRNINSGKIQLSNSDLIKALLLNKTIDIENRQQIAAQFEIMERQLSDDRFWFMLQREDIDPLKGQSRIDLLFNIVTNVKSDDYQIEPRKSFFTFCKYNVEQLIDKWKETRELYQRLRDLFDNPYSFHYVGFLIYCGQKIEVIVKDYSNSKKSEFINNLKLKIKQKLRHSSLKEYSYDEPKEVLRRLFVLHNIETLLVRYEELKNKHNLKFSFENFPFELLYNHRWNIEHIASHTDNNLKSKEDRKDWIASVESDFTSIIRNKSLKKRLQTELDNFKYKAENETNPERITKLLNILEEILNDNNERSNEFQRLKQEAEESEWKDDEKFNKLYDYVIKEVDDNPIKEDDKNGIGNLVLLDEHTNKSFHNSLFPRKRRIVIIASGLRNKKDTEKTVESVYIPICTQQVYTKSYNKQSNVNLNSWGQEDYEAYFSDMQEKLAFYFNSNQEK